MKIIVFSDVHGATHNLQKLSPLIEQSGMTFFLGDGLAALETLNKKSAAKILVVRGNCDLFCPLPTEQIIETNGKKILVTHGHRYSVKSGYKHLAARVDETGVDLALCGHTHRYYHNGKILNVPALKDGAYIELCSMSLSHKLCSVFAGE